MANGWAAEGAVQEQIEDSMADAIKRVRAQLPRGESLSHCIQCGKIIAEARRQALPGVCFCLMCQQEQDKQNAVTFNSYNRRGSKDSQLR